MSNWDEELDRGDQGEEIREPDQPVRGLDDEPGELGDLDDFGRGDVGEGDGEGDEGDRGVDRGIALRGPRASVPRARGFTKYDPPGMCLNYVWNCIASPTKFGLPDANAAWARAKKRHAGTNAPAGAPVYWAGGKHGHIAISVGGGIVRSTDWPVKGKVGEVAITQMTKSWGIPYRGWSSDYAGVDIPGLGSAAPQPLVGAAKPRIDVEAIRPGKRNASVKAFSALLWNSMPAAYRTANLAKWKTEASDLWGPIAQQVCFDKYKQLNAQDAGKWPIPSKQGGVWPGPALVRQVGGIPV